MKMVEQTGQAGQGQVVDLSGQDESPLEALLRQGARIMLLAAIETEVADYVARHAHCCDEQGWRLGMML